MKTIHVNASTRYDILIGSGLLASAGEYIKNAVGTCTVVIVSDDNVYPIYGDSLKHELESSGFKVLEYVFPHGEKSKNLSVYGDLLEFMCENRVTRKDAIAALGGGVTGDLAGFAAATYQRGIRFVQIPTTLLAAVDSSVGGKTAVDLKSGKNQAGAFHQPSLVICDTDTLKTLPEDEFSCGCAEVIKYAVLGDEAFFERLMEKDIHDQIEDVIATCVSMKRDIVEEDEFDTGKRMLLNLGHTFGHAAEACAGFGILHGQGVAMGMTAMARSAHAAGFCDEATVEKITAILKKYKLPTEIPYRLEDMVNAAFSDKKMAGSTMRIIVPERIGKCSIMSIPAEELRVWMERGGIK